MFPTPPFLVNGGNRGQGKIQTCLDISPLFFHVSLEFVQEFVITYDEFSKPWRWKKMSRPRSHFWISALAVSWGGNRQCHWRMLTDCYFCHHTHSIICKVQQWLRSRTCPNAGNRKCHRTLWQLPQQVWGLCGKKVKLMAKHISVLFLPTLTSIRLKK
jgi:hypothetical protein